METYVIGALIGISGVMFWNCNDRDEFFIFLVLIGASLTTIIYFKLWSIDYILVYFGFFFASCLCLRPTITGISLIVIGLVINYKYY